MGTYPRFLRLIGPLWYQAGGAETAKGDAEKLRAEHKAEAAALREAHAKALGMLKEAHATQVNSPGWSVNSPACSVNSPQGGARRAGVCVLCGPIGRGNRGYSVYSRGGRITACARRRMPRRRIPPSGW
eukprot:2869660-Pyramimonas_sp.AAC.1